MKKKGKKLKFANINNMKNIAFNADGTITITNADDSTTLFSSVPVVAPTDTEVDIKLSDGSTKTFVPKA